MSFLQENPDEANKIQLDFNIDIQNELGCGIDEVCIISTTRTEVQYGNNLLCLLLSTFHG